MTELNKLNNFQTKDSHENIIRQYLKVGFLNKILIF